MSLLNKVVKTKTGDQFADRDKVQILGAMDLPNGDVKMNFLLYQ